MRHVFELVYDLGDWLEIMNTVICNMFVNFLVVCSHFGPIGHYIVCEMPLHMGHFGHWVHWVPWTTSNMRDWPWRGAAR